MNENTSSPTPQEPAAQTPLKKSFSIFTQSKNGIWIWISLIVAVLAIFGLVMYFILLPEEAVGPTVIKKGEESVLQIERELKDTSLDGLDSELDAIDNELKGL